MSSPALLLPLLLWTAPPGTVSDDWYSFLLNQQKVGYLHHHDAPAIWKGEKAVKAERQMVIEVKRQGQAIRMEHDATAWFKPDGSPLHFRYASNEAGSKRLMEGEVTGQKLRVRIQTGDTTKTQLLPITPGLIFSSSLEWLLQKELKPGYQRKGQLIDESQIDVQPYAIKVLRQEVYAGQPVYVVEETVGPMVTESKFRVKDGVRLLGELSGTGIQFKKVSAAEAKRFENPSDVFIRSSIPVKQRIRRAKLGELRLLVSSRENRRIELPQTSRQKVIPGAKGRLTLSLRPAKAPKKGMSLQQAGKDPTVRAYLMPTLYEDLSNPELMATAKRLRGQDTQVWPIAQRILDFVNGHIQVKDLSKAYASATEVMASREGDCTEHSVLFSALAKSAGIPTRLITGLVYVDGSKPFFGYHAWVEVWTGDGWVEMDPTFDQTLADATHIRLAVGQSDAAGLREAGLAAAKAVGDLKLQVLSQKP